MENEEILGFFNCLDRSYFIDNEMKTFADLDTPLPIGHGQTISQPSLVLEMTQLLEPEKECKVLEIGTGSGYQTALLAKFSGKVWLVRMKEIGFISAVLTSLKYYFFIFHSSERFILNKR